MDTFILVILLHCYLVIVLLFWFVLSYTNHISKHNIIIKSLKIELFSIEKSVKILFW